MSRFKVVYDITLSLSEAIETYAREICLEQTVELPDFALSENIKKRRVVGEIESIYELQPHRYRVTLSFLSEITAYSIPQFLNTLYGNISLKKNIRILDVHLTNEMKFMFPGPVFGIQGVRTLLNIWKRPLSCTALKPVGMSSDEIAAMAYTFAMGGTDIIKDDHGMTNQSFSTFSTRVTAVQKSLHKAQKLTGKKVLYCPMVNDEPEQIEKQIKLCINEGVEGILAAPMLIGPAVFSSLVKKQKWVVMAHPAFSGMLFQDPHHGIEPGFFLGTFFRWLGADMSVFPNSGGRFGFTSAQCQQISDGLRKPDDHFKPAFPAPAGGMSIERIPELIQQYGADMILVIGGQLRQGDLLENTQNFSSGLAKYSH